MANRGGWTLPPQDDGPDEEQMAQLAPRLRLRLLAACKACDFEHNTPTPGKRLRTQACGAESLAKPTSTLSYRALSAKGNTEVRLPAGPHCNCGRCWKHWETHAQLIARLQGQLEQHDKNSRSQFQYSLMRAVLAKDNVPVIYVKKTRWTVLGVEWCAPMFRKIVKLSRSSFRRCTKDILNGQLVWEPQLVLPKRLSHKDRPQRAHVAAWLRWVYDRLATNFAEVREKLDRDTGGLPMEDLAQEGIGESAIEPFNPLAVASTSLAYHRKKAKIHTAGWPCRALCDIRKRMFKGAPCKQGQL